MPQYDFRIDDLSIHIEWSDVDGAERLTAFGWLPAMATGTWHRCSVGRVPRGDAGEQVIDFSRAAFERLARGLEASIRHDPQSALRYVLDPVDPQQPGPRRQSSPGTWCKTSTL